MEEKKSKKTLEEDLGSVRIGVIGIGGGGGSTVERVGKELVATGLYNSKERNLLMALINTDARALKRHRKDLERYRKEKKVIGEIIPEENFIKIGRGLGGGGDPLVGARIMQKAIDDGKLEYLFEDGLDMLFVVCTLGKATGTGAGPVFLEYAIEKLNQIKKQNDDEIEKENKVLPISLVTLPFSFEAKERWKNAIEGYKKFKTIEGIKLLTLYNDNLENLAIKEYKENNIEDIPMGKLFSLSDGVLSKAIRTVVDVADRSGYVDTDFSDVRSTLRYGANVLFNSGCASGKKRTEEIKRQLFKESLYGEEDKLLLDGAHGVLVSFYAKKSEDSISHTEIKDVTGAIRKIVDEDANIIYGITSKGDMKDGDLEVTVMATGFKEEEPVFEEAAVDKGAYSIDRKKVTDIRTARTIVDKGKGSPMPFLGKK